ncbi:lysM and putative peptidoglycan-binding domain-containing protein 3-like [Liolophura sinensis]|uniref:lysM and putative peptidoglycan-binding domain-containing protein 3-like n=1 Tax=Liolophura sinensis TaxID=3198878 RepID=UPI00315971AC
MSGGYIRAKEKAKVEYDGSSDEKDTERSSTTEVTRRGRTAGFSSGQTQNCRAARVYVFGQHDIYEDDDKDIEMSEIRSRKSTRNSSYDSGNSAETENIFFERQIVEEDTLLSIALQYGCPVSELKRINKLMQDQDFFALKSIKVPIKRYGLLTEMLEEQKKTTSAAASANYLPKSRANGTAGGDRTDYVANDINEDSDNCLSDPEMQHLLIRTLSIRDNINSQSKEAEEFLNSMDRDLQNIRKSTNSYKPSLQAVTFTLTDKRIQPLQKKSVDCTPSWRQIILAVVVVAVVVPLIFIVVYCYKGTCQWS